MGPMKKQLFDLNKLPEDTEMEEQTEAWAPQAMAGPPELPGSDVEAQEHGSTFDRSDVEMGDTHAVSKVRDTIMRREPEVSLQESAYTTSWLHQHIGWAASHPGTVQNDALQQCHPPSAMQVGGPAVGGSSNALLGIVGTPTALQINQASTRDLPAGDLRRSCNRRPARSSQPEIKAVSSTKRRGHHGPKSKSSEFLAVTLNKRTQRWEAHMWHDNEQVLYRGAPSTKESAARAIYEEAVRRDYKSAAEPITDSTRVPELPTSTGLRPAQESECALCAQKDQSNSKMQITRKRTPAICNLELRLPQVPTFKEAGQQSNSRSQQASVNCNTYGQTNMSMVVGWPVTAPAPFYGPSTGNQTMVAPQRCELPPMPLQTGCNLWNVPPPTKVGFQLFKAHMTGGTPLQQPPTGAALPSTNLRTRDNERRLYDRYMSWLAHATVLVPWRYKAETNFTSRYGLPRRPRK